MVNGNCIIIQIIKFIYFFITSHCDMTSILRMIFIYDFRFSVLYDLRLEICHYSIMLNEPVWYFSPFE